VRIKVAVIGAGSASFGRGAIADLLSSEELKETDLTVNLVDIDESALNRMFRFAKLVKQYRHSNANIEATTDRCEALKGANYVITAVARRRYELWDRDFYTPFTFGFKHVFGENGGPGAAFHTMRSLNLMVPIAKDMEKICPDALLINYTNPESRVCMGVKMLTKVRAVGLCHGAFATHAKVAEILGRQKEAIDITIGGLNHFHWVLEIRDKATGKDLHPEFRRRMSELDVDLEPLTRAMYETFSLLPFPVDDHIGEYVSFAYDITGPLWTIWMRKMVEYERRTYGVVMTRIERIQRVVEGKEPLTEDLARPSGELAVPIICDIEFDRKRRELSVNIPNDGSAVSNLPEDAIVEIPALVDAKGLHPVKVGPLPEPIAAICRTQITIQKLLVEAYAKRSKKLLLQALAIDPVVDSIPRAQKLMDEMLRIESDYLPEFED